MADLRESMWNLTIQPLKTYIHDRNAYGYQTR